MNSVLSLKNRALEIWNHAGFQKYFRNTGWMFVGRVFSLVISFVVGIYIARYLGPANYGLFSYVISFVGLFGFMATLGLDDILNRNIIKNHEDKDILIGTSFYLKLIGSILAIITIFVVSILITKDFFTLLLIWLFSLTFIPASFNVLEVYFNSQVLSKKVVVAQIIGGMASAILKLLLIYFDKGIFWLTTIYILETFIVACVLLYYFKSFGNHLRKWKFNFNIAKSLLKDSWPLILSSVAIGIYMKIDQVMIKNMLGDTEVGLYAVAVKLSEVWYFIPGIIMASIFPAIVSAHNRSEEEFNKRMGQLYFVMFWSSVLIALSTTFLAGPIIKILFGQEYIQSIKVLQIHIWSGIFVFIGLVVSKFLLTNNYTKILLLGTITGSIINIVLNIILINKMGVTGAAISTLVSYSTSVFIILFIKKTRNHGILMIKSFIINK
jgi:O-antigen/teichoic acid export membrane protein